jgi:hypothetical protein
LDVKAYYGRLLHVSMALVLMSGCSGSKVTIKASSQVGKYQIHKIALIPFETMRTPQAVSSNEPSLPVPSGARRSEAPIAFPPMRHQGVRTTHVVPPAAGEKITDLMLHKLKTRSGLQVLSPGDAAIVAQELAEGKTPEPVAAHKIAQRLGADAALSGKVLVYQERVGGRLGADPPAVVGFEVKLIAPDGNVLWEGNYYEKQRPMIEDIVGFFQRYGMFVTAEELADYGAGELAEALPVGGSSK